MSKIDELLKNENVEWKKLGEVCEIKRGRVISKAYLEQNPGDFPVYSSQTRNNGEIGKINTYDFDGEYATWTTDGAYAGTVFYRNGKFSITNICGLIKPNDSKRLLVKYIVYWLQIEANKYVKGGSGNPKLMSNVVANIKIPIPSLETQEKIVKILDKFTNYVTELQAQLQAELQARNKQYEYYRDMLLSEDYLSKLSNEMDNLISKDYEIKIITLGKIAKISRGASPRPIKKYITNDEEGIPWIKIGDVSVNSKYVTKTEQKISLEGAEKSRVLKKGDFIMSNSMSFGRPYILNIDGAIHDGWASISEFHDFLDPDFLYYYLTSSQVKNYWEGKINSSSVSNLNSEIIRSLPVPIIDKKLQKLVANILDKFQDLLSDTQGLLPEEIEQRRKQYEYYREKLLTFDGNMLERERERAYLSKSYLKSLKEAGEIVGVSFFNIEKKNLGEISDIVLGGTPNKTKHEYWENGTIPWMSSGEVNKKKIYSTDNFITQAGYDNSSATMVPADSTVIALAGQGKTRGLVARIKISLSTNQSLATLIPKDIIINDYLYYYLESQYNKLREVSSGDGSRGGLNKEILKRYPIIIPPIPIQDYIVSILDKFDKLVNDINEGLPKEIELRQKQYEYYRERLLNFPK